jgi:type IV pilus assembly protein PilM
VVCLGGKDLFLHSVRVPKSDGPGLAELVQKEAAARLPFPIAEAEIRQIEAADIRQGETLLREVIVLACHRPGLDTLLEAVEMAGLRPVAVDAEPLALLRGYVKQQRRDEDRKLRTLYVHVGYSRAIVMITEGEDLLFVKYADLGGQALDEAVARRLQMNEREAASLRRHNGDRRADQQDPEVTASIVRAVRPVIERLVSELSLCIRYHSVTFRGQPLARLVLGGGEASEALLSTLSERLNLKCELSEPLRGLAGAPRTGRSGQWDVAAGLAWRETN